MKKTHICIIEFFALALSCFIGLMLYFLFTPVITQKEGASYYLRPGATKKIVAYDLSQQGIINHPMLLLLYAFPHKNYALKTGEYYFPKGSTPYSIWKQFRNGTGRLYHPFAVIPGWNFKQLRAELLKTQGLRHTTAAFTDNQIMERLGYPNLSPEGEFFPDTYNYTRGDTDLGILKRAFNLMQIKLQKVWNSRASELPYQNAYEALIAASMIEKEGYLDKERPLIAGVLINRLKKGMLLQIDATIIFGLGDRYDGKIYKQNLREDTPYNTYLHKGLPPTPIAMPGLSSLQAATHPQQNNFYYYVAKGNGSHEFSTTLQEHYDAVQSTVNQQNGETIIPKPTENPVLPYHQSLLTH